MIHQYRIFLPNFNFIKTNKAKEKSKDAMEAAKAKAERLAALYKIRKEFLDDILSGGIKTIVKLPGMPDFPAIGSKVKSKTAAASAETQQAAAQKRLLQLITI